MSEREILVKQIADGKDAEQKLAELDKELRHGDYGYYADGGLWFVLRRNSSLEVFGEIEGQGRQPTKNWPDMKTRLSNFYDDLKRNSVDLKEFKVSADGNEKYFYKLITSGANCFIITSDSWMFSLNQLIEINQKTGQVICTAKRCRNKSRG